MNKEKTMNSFKTYFLYFMFYAIFGWCYEVFLEVVVYQWGFSNRGVLFGPYCPIYGFGALLFIFCLGKIKREKVKIGRLNITPIVIFAGVVIIATTVELLASYIMEFTIGSWMWDYERFAFDFQGRIALNPSIRFGIGGVFFMYVLQPIFEKITGAMSPQTLNRVFIVIFSVVCMDAVWTLFFR